jgi:phosphotransferase system enzyme I (PtsI)
VTSVCGEIRLQGVPISSGIAIGVIQVFHHNEEWIVPEYEILEEHIELEIGRYKLALSKSQQNLVELKDLFQEEGGSEGATIIEAQIQMLNDPLLTIEIEEKIRASRRNAESVFKTFISDYIRFFDDESDPEIHQRLLDVKDVAARLLKHLYPEWTQHDEKSLMQSIVCSYELIPSHTAEATLGEVQAFITEIGGSTSHAALIAKSKAIPYVSNIKIDVLKESGGSMVIVDGNYGSVIINPSKATISMYQTKQRGQSVRFDVMKEDESEVRTLDGTVIDVQANVQDLTDLDLLKRAKIKKIGLVRTEFLFMRKELENVGENEQYQLYKKFLQLSGNMQVVFRLFDIGSDKKMVSGVHQEPNPALGERSIRFLLKHRKFFSTQIRAILKASAFGNLHIMLPLVTDMNELMEAKTYILEEHSKLIREGFDLPERLSIGCMVEVPAFVIMCDELIKETDFLSIGTNDLVQYTLAVDRSNPLTSNRYGEAHPSILRMIEQVVKIGKKAKVPVSICGEIASNSDYTKKLLDLGVRALSCSPRYIPAIKRAIRSIDLQN